MSRLRRGPNGLPVATSPPAAEAALSRAAAALAKGTGTARVSTTARPVSGKTRVAGRVSTRAVAARTSTRSSGSAAASALAAVKSADATRMKAETKRLEEETRAMEEKLKALQSRMASEKKGKEPDAATWKVGSQGPIKGGDVPGIKVPRKLVSGARVVKGEGGKVVVRVRKSALAAAATSAPPPSSARTTPSPQAAPTREGGSMLARAMEEGRSSRAASPVPAAEPEIRASTGLWKPRIAPKTKTVEEPRGVVKTAESGIGGEDDVPPAPVGGGGLLLQGNYDEAAASASFAEAVAEWRAGGGPQKESSESETQAERPGTAKTDAGVGAEGSGGLGAVQMPEWSFQTTSGLSYGNRLLLKRLRAAAASRGEAVPSAS